MTDRSLVGTFNQRSTIATTLFVNLTNTGNSQQRTNPILYEKYNLKIKSTKMQRHWMGLHHHLSIIIMCILAAILAWVINRTKNNIYSQTVCSFVLLYASCVFLYVNGGHLKKIGGHLAALADLKFRKGMTNFPLFSSFFLSPQKLFTFIFTFVFTFVLHLFVSLFVSFVLHPISDSLLFIIISSSIYSWYLYSHLISFVWSQGQLLTLLFLSSSFVFISHLTNFLS